MVVPYKDEERLVKASVIIGFQFCPRRKNRAYNETPTNKEKQMNTATVAKVAAAVVLVTVAARPVMKATARLLNKTADIVPSV